MTSNAGVWVRRSAAALLVAAAALAIATLAGERHAAPRRTTAATTGSTTPAELGARLPPPLAASHGRVVVARPVFDLGPTLNALGPGDILELRGGVYGKGNRRAAVMLASGTATAPITITALPSQRPVIAQLLKIAGAYVRVSGLTIVRNAYPTDARFGQRGSSPGGGVGIWLAGPHVTLEQSEVRGSTMSGVFGGGTGDQILGNWIHDNGTTHDDHGLYLAGAQRMLVANNVVEHNACFGVQIQYGATDVVVANNTIAYNGLRFGCSGTVQNGSSHGLLWVNDIAYGNGNAGFESYTAGQDNALSHVDAWANAHGQRAGTFDAVDQLLTVDPLFVDPAAGDYRLRSGSPMAGAGDTAFTPPLDRDGRPRTGPDLGAYAAAG